MISPKGRFRVGSLLLLSLIASLQARASDFVQARIDGLTNTGDVMAYVLPATALGLTLYKKDGDGARQFAESVGIAMAVTVGLKYSVNARRPDGDPHSFPSGHAAITFSSAEFMRARYGWKYGAPAYVLASFVAYSRVRAHKHYFRDVAAGGIIGVVSSHIMTRRFHGWQIQPELGLRQTTLRVSRDF